MKQPFYSRIERCVINDKDDQASFYEFVNTDSGVKGRVPCWCLDKFAEFPPELLDADGLHLREGAEVELCDMGNNKTYPSGIYKKKTQSPKTKVNKKMSEDSLYENICLYKYIDCNRSLAELWDLYFNADNISLWKKLICTIALRDKDEKKQRQFLLSELSSSSTLPIQEGEHVEFKSSFLHTSRPMKNNERMQQYRAIFAEMLAFANSHVEGTVFVGIDDKGKIQGVEKELLAEAPFGSRADFELDFLNQLHILTKNHAFVSTIKMEWFQTEDHKVFCKIVVPKWTGSILLLNGTELFVRSNAGKRQLRYNDMIQYVISGINNSKTQTA